MSQRELADLLGLDRCTVSRLEAGRREARGLVREVYLALLLASARGVDLSAVLDRARSRGLRLLALFRGAYDE
ncbi:helix-turn-helix domain-containing protein [Nannocystis bainbridge]|uniref:Helix-turn-helix domain-containing protein n=1 Tax=Nannocystis bainbridge TaxID=2995303 RepID=A0ABT5E479_9BACT|nr:helix-turn-helix domain-containing protein [Nannocystis bainbridge]MDC0720668.1 helix-turn-helix domain-containing protein [Nannocystis bainbridge]